MTKYKEEQYRLRYLTDNWQCQHCGKQATQIAHRLGDTKVNKKKYGYYIINHVNNLVSTCSLECNKVFDIGFNNKDRLFKLLIYLHSDKIYSSEEITEGLE